MHLAKVPYMIYDTALFEIDKHKSHAYPDQQ